MIGYIKMELSREVKKLYLEGKYINGTDDLSEIYQIRREVFGTEEFTAQGYFDLDCSMICDQLAVHAIAKIEGTAVGCGTLFYDGETFLLDLIGVPVNERRKKYGDFLVRMLIDRAFSRGAQIIYAYCTEEIVPFFHSIGFSREKEKAGTVLLSLRQRDICRKCGDHKK